MRYHFFKPMRTNPTDTDGNHHSPRATYPYYVLFVLGLVNLFNYVDRHILSVLIRPIQEAWSLTVIATLEEFNDMDSMEVLLWQNEFEGCG